MAAIRRLFKSYKTPEEKKSAKKQLLLGLLSAFMMGFSFPPFPSFILIFFGMVPYLYVLEQREGLAAINRFTYFTAFIFNLITIHWIGAWSADADPFLMIAGSVLLFFNPLLFLIPSTLYYMSVKSFGRKVSLSLFPVFWVFYEYIYSVSDLKFPWLTLANGVTHFASYIQIADIIGAYGISLLILYTNLSFYSLINSYIMNGRIPLSRIVIPLFLLVPPVVYGIVKINGYEESAEKFKFGVVQPDLNPWKKWEAGNLYEQLDIYLNMSKEAAEKDARVILWPETALPVYLMSGNYPKAEERIRGFVDSNNVFLLTGMPDVRFYFDSTNAPPDAKKTASSSVRYTSFNSVLLFSPGDRKVERYGKIKLVPFSEKVPFVEHIPILGDIIKWNVGISSWNTGRDTVVFTLEFKDKKIEGTDSIKIAGVVCIESIYPDFIASFVQKGADVIVVVTNDSWYEGTIGPYQHKEFSVLRAVENRRTLIRAANGGISCFIDPLGRTYSFTEMGEKTLLIDYAAVNKHLTFYTKYPLIIPVIVVSISIWLAGIFLLKTINKKKKIHKA